MAGRFTNSICYATAANIPLIFSHFYLPDLSPRLCGIVCSVQRSNLCQVPNCPPRTTSMLPISRNSPSSPRRDLPSTYEQRSRSCIGRAYPQSLRRLAAQSYRHTSPAVTAQPSHSYDTLINQRSPRTRHRASQQHLSHNHSLSTGWIPAKRAQSVLGPAFRQMNRQTISSNCIYDHNVRFLHPSRNLYTSRIPVSPCK